MRESSGRRSARKATSGIEKDKKGESSAGVDDTSCLSHILICFRCMTTVGVNVCIFLK